MSKPPIPRWQPAKTAPLDTVFIGDFGYPWPLATIWNEHDEKFCYAFLNAEPIEGGKNDFWFETERENRSALLGWMPMPAMPERKKKMNSTLRPDALAIFHALHLAGCLVAWEIILALAEKTS